MCFVHVAGWTPVCVDEEIVPENLQGKERESPVRSTKADAQGTNEVGGTKRSPQVHQFQPQLCRIWILDLAPNCLSTHELLTQANQERTVCKVVCCYSENQVFTINSHLISKKWPNKHQLQREFVAHTWIPTRRLFFSQVGFFLNLVIAT